MDQVSEAAGSPHIPVLYHEVLEVLAPNCQEVILDGTLGAAGHASALLGKAQPGGFLIGLDQDSELLEIARKRLISDGWREGSDFALFHRKFSRALDLVQSGQVPQPSIMFFDYGINSLHVDEASRGFSFRLDGPLDMRMNSADSGIPTAADLIATLDHPSLARIFRELGEERFAGQVASAILRERGRQPITTTSQLAQVVSAAIPRKAWPPKTHPATRVFQALRMAVNGELEEIQDLLDTLPQLIPHPGNRAGIIGFHSLELRPVKERFRSLAQACKCPPEFPVCNCGAVERFRLLTRSGIGPGATELDNNPRARSARLWALQRIAPD